MSAPSRVVARWAARRATTGPAVCGECGEHLDLGTTQCPQCRQAAATTATGMLAVVVETTGGDRRLVVAERTPTGGWAPTRHLSATGEAVRALARQDATRGGAA
jgi:RNA polymerase subunit RPABC4/transcription elongation factor Spt4